MGNLYHGYSEYTVDQIVSEGDVDPGDMGYVGVLIKDEEVPLSHESQSYIVQIAMVVVTVAYIIFASSRAVVKARRNRKAEDDMDFTGGFR